MAILLPVSKNVESLPLNFDLYPKIAGVFSQECGILRTMGIHVINGGIQTSLADVQNTRAWFGFVDETYGT